MSKEYDNYIIEHKRNVTKGYAWIQDNLPELLDGVGHFEWLVSFNHDVSKYTAEEYDAYDAYFYGGNRSFAVCQAFNKAWLHHIHNNPHHWQHWILIHDEPDEPMTIIDMPYGYIIEMICDWWSFSWKKGDLSEIFNWYDSHKDYIKLSDSTRKTVEMILGKIKDKLEEKGDDKTRED